MSKTLLTDRLAVIGQTRLKQTFSSCLVYAFKGVKNLPSERQIQLLSAAEDFQTKPDTYIRFREFCMKPENIHLWVQTLSDSVYSFTLLEKLQPKIQQALEDKEIQLEDLWNLYLYIYARKLLHLGAQTICNEKNGFNKQTVHHFITNPHAVHGSELINDIPPLLEKGYIHLNNCGFNQQTDWHRNTFMDSYFLALMSYQSILSKSEIARSFQITQT